MLTPITYHLTAPLLLSGLLAAGLALAGCAPQTPQGSASDDVGAPDDRAYHQVVLVTGSTAGLGAEVARRLAAHGHHVIIHGRNVERGQAMVAEIETEGVGSAAFYDADLADLDAVRDLADAIIRDYDRLDVVVNNAGVWINEPDRRVSADGHELHFAVNYLAGFLLTHRLLPLIERSAPARIVNVASAAQQPIDFDNVMLEHRYTPGRGYAQSKLAQVLFTFDLAEELAGTDVTVVALHPATLMDTPMVRGAGATPRSTVDEGAAAVMNVVMSPAIESGTYFNGLEPARAHDQAYDEGARDQLRRLAMRLTGVDTRRDDQASFAELTAEPAQARAGGQVDLTLRSHSEREIGYNLCPAVLDRLVDSEWQEHPERPAEICTMELRVLDPGESDTFRHTLPAGLPAGSYRFRVGVEWPLGEDRVEITSGAVEVR